MMLGGLRTSVIASGMVLSLGATRPKIVFRQFEGGLSDVDILLSFSQRSIRRDHLVVPP